MSDFAERIKGTTLESIYTHWFAHLRNEQPEITRRLNEFEQQMQYTYIKGVCSFIKSLREVGIKTAIVTACNEAKMRSLLRVHPELPTLFDRILTSKDYATGKPPPTAISRGPRSSVPAPKIAWYSKTASMACVPDATQEPSSWHSPPPTPTRQ